MSAWRATLRTAASGLVVASLCACRGGAHRAESPRGPTIGIAVEAPALTGDQVETSITGALERVCAAVPHVAHIHSVSQDGLSTIDVELEPHADVEVAWRELERMVRQAGPSLPAGARPASVTRGGGAVVYRYTLSSNSLPLAALGALQQSEVVTRLQQVPGVHGVATCGADLPRITVQLDATALASAGLTVADVVAATAAQGPSSDAASLAGVVLAKVNGTPIRVRDVGTVRDDATPPPCRANDERGAVSEGIVQATDLADPAAVRTAIDEALRVVERTLPPGVLVRRMGPSRQVTVDLDPAIDPRAASIYLHDAATGAAPGAHLLIEMDVPDPQAAPTGARVLLEAADEAVLARVIAALRALPAVRSAGEANATVQLIGMDRAALGAAGAELARRLAAGGALVARQGFAEKPTTRVIVDPEAAARLGVSRSDVDLVLAARRGEEVGAVRVNGLRIPVAVRLAGSTAQTYVKTSSGTLVPLEAIAASRAELTAAAILHEDRSPMVRVRVRSADLAGLRHVLETPPGIEMRVIGD